MKGFFVSYFFFNQVNKLQFNRQHLNQTASLQFGFNTDRAPSPEVIVELKCKDGGASHIIVYVSQPG